RAEPHLARTLLASVTLPTLLLPDALPICLKKRVVDDVAGADQDPVEHLLVGEDRVPLHLDRPGPVLRAFLDPHVQIDPAPDVRRSEEHTSELQSPDHLLCRLLLQKKNTNR